jgi:O-antigen/teichoic acid export membrane protein
VNGAAGFLLVLAVTRLLGRSEAGTLFVMTSIFLILLAAVELGVTTGLVRSIPQYLAAGRQPDLRALLRTAVLPVLAVSTLVAVLLWPLAPWVIGVLAPHGTGGTGGTDGPQVLRLVALLLPVAAVYDVLLAATRGFGRIRPTVLVERIGRVPGQLVLVLVAGLVTHRLLAVSVAWALPYLPGLLVAGWLTVRLLLRAERMADRGRVVTEPGVGAEFWRYTWARGLSRIFQVALQRLDIVLISAVLGTRDAAVYTAATRLVPVGLLGVQAVQQVLQPQLATLLARHDLPAARRVYRASTAWAVALSWPVYCTAAVTAPLVLALFGPGYRAGAGAMVWVSLAMLVATASGAADLALLMAGRSALSLANTALALLADILLNLLLLPRLGITGAGIAWAVSILLTNLPALEQVRRSVGLAPFSRGAGVVAAASVLLFGAGSATVGRLFPGSVAALAGWLVLAGCSYLLVLHRARGLLDLDGLLAGRGRGRRGRAGKGPRGRRRR